MKKGLKALVSLLFVCVASSCSSTSDTSANSSANSASASTSTTTNSAASSFVAGLVSVGDTTETYSKAHIDGFKSAAEKLGIPSNNLVIKTNVPESSAVTNSCNDIYSNGAKIIFTNSYGHQDFACSFAKDHSDVTVVADTGDYAFISGLNNFKNAFTNIYEARYVSGIVGGMKLKELEDSGKLTSSNYDSDGNVLIGYVGAYTYAEVISGYSAFYLGVKAGYGKDTVKMKVQFTDSWYDHDAEGAAADTLVESGCVIIGQHADSTGAPEHVEAKLNAGKVCYSVGYNVDMLSAAPKAALTSATNNWERYYEYALGQALNDQEVSVDWAKGYADNAVGITTLGPNVASGTAEKVAEIETQLKNGTFHVFDTSKFTVDGERVTSHTFDFSYRDWSNGGAVVYEGQSLETVKTDGDVSYIEESVVRSAPYFDLKMDGIEWLNK